MFLRKINESKKKIVEIENLDQRVSSTKLTLIMPKFSQIQMFYQHLFLLLPFSLDLLKDYFKTSKILLLNSKI